MRNFLKNSLMATMTFLVLMSSSVAPISAQTNEWSGVCVGPESDLGVDASEVATIQGLECLIANVFVVIITIIGLAGFVMFIVGSIRWMLSGSSSGGTDKARGTMTYAVAGIVVALSAFIIINLIASFTGVETIKTFIIPESSRNIPPPAPPAPPGPPGH